MPAIGYFIFLNLRHSDRELAIVHAVLLDKVLDLGHMLQLGCSELHMRQRLYQSTINMVLGSLRGYYANCSKVVGSA